MQPCGCGYTHRTRISIGCSLVVAYVRTNKNLDRMQPCGCGYTHEQESRWDAACGCVCTHEQESRYDAALWLRIYARTIISIGCSLVVADIRMNKNLDRTQPGGCVCT